MPDEDWQKSICARPPTNLGVGIFPGEQSSLGETTYISHSAQTRNISNAVRTISPAVVTCVVYRDAITGKWHHTPIS
jgi:hypothetical protein